MRALHALPVWVAILLASIPSTPVYAGDRVGACGGAGERACCFDEAFPSCDGDNVEIDTDGGACEGPISGFFGARAGTCTLNTQNPNNNAACGGEGQRACCIGEAAPSCDAGLLELNPPGGTGQFCPGGGPEAGICFAPTACGAPGQRACCTTEHGAGTPACNDDAAPLDGGIGAQEYCGDATSAFLGMVPGKTCVAVTACGGVGQRACCAVPTEQLALGKAACDDGAVELAGVTGDATCTDNIATTGAASGTCIATTTPNVPVNESGTVEPTTNWSPATTTPLPAGSLRGYADLHLHVLAHLAHGKQILAGYPAPVGPDGHINPTAAPSASVALSPIDDILKHGPPLHAPIIGDTVGFGTKDSTLSNYGWPYFSGWPSWNSTTHQQVYYKWLERAWRGGMRLTTMLAVTNEAMCKSNNTYGTPDYDACSTSMTSILEQLQTVWDFQAFIDNQSGGPGLGWFRIVTTPDQARDVIRAGKLAVVLGIEVDNLFGCKESGCPKVTHKDANGAVIVGADGLPVLFDMNIAAEVDKIYALGVRHVFPVHNFDNAFGAAATWQDIIGVGQAVSEGRYWKVRNCRPEGYGFSISFLVSELAGLLGYNTAALPANDLPLNVGSGGATCNQYGLYSTRINGDQRKGTRGYGPELINALMDRGMLIDIDHMSARALDETLVLSKQRWAQYPLVASHVQFFDRHVQDFQPLPDPDLTGGGNAGRHERMRTAAQLAAIREGGGMVAAMLKDDAQDGGNAGKQVTIAYSPLQGPPVANNCVHSSKSFAQSYQYAVDVMGGPVAFGSDFNGIAGHIGPRFGSEACAATFDNEHKTAERLAQEAEGNRVPYPFELPGFGTLDRQVTGLKTFDYNTDGMAHVGLLPDFVKDLSQVGLSAEYMDAIFCSAERYIQVWERGVVISQGAGGTLPDYTQMTCNRDVPVGDTTPPVSSASAAPAPSAAGWNNTAVTVTVDAHDEVGGSGLQMIAYTATGASTFADSSPVSPATTPITNEGATLFTYYSRDIAGNVEAKKSLQVRIDRTPPTITGSRTPAANAAGWNNAGVTATFICADVLSGIATCSLPQSFIAEGAAQGATGTALDKAGNTAVATVVGINIDLTPPTIAGAAAPAPNAAGWNNGNVVVTFTCADALAGVASCTAPVTLGTEGVNLSASGTVIDSAGNTAAASVVGIKLDKTKPVVEVTGVTDGGVYTYGSVPVAGCTTADALSGVATSATIQVTGGTSNGVGSYTATCSGAMDVAGNGNSKSVSYAVHYDFRGFFNPVDNLPTLNAVTAGQAIPIKFSLGGDFGLDILAAGSPVSVGITCLTGGLVDDIEETVTAGSSALAYSGGQYQYVWKSSKPWAGSCRALQLKLDDGTTHTANFKFR